ncbi:MAG: cation diffusion facilitator family transporter [Actinobacteria bacterium]|nr:cation diffusion facilitator family transporter [Actinomycetota bacterium]
MSNEKETDVQALGQAAGPADTPDRRLILSLALNLVITIMQIVGGLLANSLGLLSDAAHNLSDVVALGLSLWAVRLGRRPATRTRTFAYKRAEILVALFNSTVLVAISLYLIIEAVRRILNPEPVEGLFVIAFAGAGLVINGLAAATLRSHLQDLNLRAAFLHLVGDAMTSVAVIVSGLIVYLLGWSYADPIVTIVVSLWIGRAAFAIVRSAVNVLMEGTPEGLEFGDVEEAILKTPGVAGVHDLHIWSISSADLALSAHLQLAEEWLTPSGELLLGVKEMLAHDFGIGHATLELEPAGEVCAGSTCVIAPRVVGGSKRHAGPAGESHSR